MEKEVEVLLDLKKLNRKEFLNKYHIEFPYFSKTRIKIDMFSDGYADLRGYEYYELPSMITLYGSRKNRKITYNQNNMLYKDACTFIKILEEDLSFEYLLYLMVFQVYNHYERQSDIDDNTIIKTVRKALLNNGEAAKPINKKYVVDKTYWTYNDEYNWPCKLKKNGKDDFDYVYYVDWDMVNSIIRHRIKDKDINSIYQKDLTIEDNINKLKEYGVIVKNTYLMDWCNRNGHIYKTELETDKEKRNRVVIELYKQGKSTRDISVRCNELKIKVSKSTVNNIINQFTKSGE